MSKAKPPYPLRASHTRLFLAIQDAFLDRNMNFSFVEVLDKWPGERGRMVLRGESEASSAGVYVLVWFYGQGYDVRLGNDQIDHRLGRMIEEIVHPNLVVSATGKYTWNWRLPDNPSDPKTMLTWVDKILKRVRKYEKAMVSAKELFAQLEIQELKTKAAEQDVINAITSVLIASRVRKRQ